MPFDNSRTLLASLTVVFARNLPPLRDRIADGRRRRSRAPAKPAPSAAERRHRNEAYIPHELIALGPGVAPEHVQLSLIWGEAENRVERGGLARAVGTDESEGSRPLFHTQIDAVQRDGCAEGPYGGRVLLCMPWLQPSFTSVFDCAASGDDPWFAAPSSSSSASVRAVEWLHRPWAILPQETSGVRPAEADCAPPALIEHAATIAYFRPVARPPVVDSLRTVSGLTRYRPDIAHRR